MGFENAQRRVRSLLKERNVGAVVSIGFAGGLSPSLRVGDLAVGREVRGIAQIPLSAEVKWAAESLRAKGLAVYFGTIMSVDEIIGKAAAKRSLADLLPADEIGCLDMESSAIAQVCAERRVPFLSIRCISDTVDEDLPIDFNQCRNPDWSLSFWRILRAVLLHPRAIKGVWELRRRSRLCAENLALFIEQLLPISTS
jgi:adenosylhomocysteine nucleosidase